MYETFEVAQIIYSLTESGEDVLLFIVLLYMAQSYYGRVLSGTL